MLSIASVTENLWQQLMESGIFDDYYPQRVNACFHYLSDNQQSFGLKDLIQKATYCFTYLGIDVEKDSNFATMDVFRTFDRSGSNNVALEDFLLGIIERLYLLRRDTNLLETIADLLLSVESRVIELSTLLEKGNSKNNKFSKFNNNLGALSFYIRNDIKLMKSQQNILVLSKEILVQIFQRCISQGIADLQAYFHLSPTKLSTLLVNVTSEELDGIVVQPLSMMWNYKEVIKNSLTPSSSSAAPAAGNLLGQSTRRQSRNEELSAEDMIAQFLSSMDENKLNQPKGQQHTSHSPNQMNVASVPSMMRDLLNPQALADMDSSKLYLLQQAYDGLNHFFTLFNQIQSGATVDPPTLHNTTINNHIHIHNTQVNNNLNINVNNFESNVEGKEMMGNSNVDAAVFYEDYYSLQHRLKNLNNKVEILEMIQSDHVYHIRSIQDGDDSNAVDECTPTYGDIMEELQFLGVKLSERASNAFPLGCMQENPYLNMIPNADNNVFLSLYNMEQMAYEVLENIYAFQERIYQVQRLIQDTSQKEGMIKELVHNREAYNFERNDLITLNLEIQVLKDKLNKYNKDENLYKMIETKNLELNKKIKELEEQITTLQNEKKMPSNTINNTSSNRVQSNNVQSTGSASANSSTAHSNHSSSSVNVTLMQTTSDLLDSSSQTNSIVSNAHLSDSEKIKKLVEYITSLTMHMTNLSKDNNKFQANITFYEKRIKNSINDQMLLHNTIHSLEDEIALYKSNITKLTREVEDHKVYKHYKEEYDKQIFTYQQQISQYKNEIVEAQNNLLLANKYHNDLIQAERTIEGLEHRISEYNIELEKGNIAMAQLENFREQLKAKTKETRDMSLHIHGLENQLKEVPYINNRYQEVLLELQECKGKVEKIPGLLAEIARLRGSARASIKALAEQDKMLSVYKNRVKALEKETALLKHDNRALQDVENKLKEANTEVKRLMTIIAEHGKEGKEGPGGAGHGGGGAAVSPMNKKMQKYMRQSAFFATNSMTHKGTSGSGGAGGGTGEGDDATT